MGHTHPRPPPPDSQWSPKETGSWGRGEAGLAEADNIWLAIRTLDRPRDQMGVESPLLQNRPVSRKGPGPLPAQETLASGLPEATQSWGQAMWQAEVSRCHQALRRAQASGWKSSSTPGSSSLASIPHFLPRPGRLLLSPSVSPRPRLQVLVSSLMDKCPPQVDLPPNATPSEPLLPGHLRRSVRQGPRTPEAPKEPLGFLSPNLPLRGPVALGRVPPLSDPTAQAGTPGTSSILSHLPALSPPRLSLPLNLSKVSPPLGPTPLAHLDSSNGLVSSCHRCNTYLLGSHLPHPTLKCLQRLALSDAPAPRRPTPHPASISCPGSQLPSTPCHPVPSRSGGHLPCQTTPPPPSFVWTPTHPSQPSRHPLPPC